jgi:polysaccharide export outer membrane protein
LALALLSTIAAGCAGCAERPYVWVGSVPVVPENHALIAPRDTLYVLVRNQPTMSGEFVVRDDGGYVQPTVGDVMAAGKETTALAAELKARMQHMIVDPDVNVAIAKPAPIRVSVVGEVKTPGLYELKTDRGVVTALAAAGWLTDFAHRDRVFVIRQGGGGAGAPVEVAQRIRFRVDDLTSPESNAARFRVRDGDVVVVE